jgi:cell division protein DivIC
MKPLIQKIPPILRNKYLLTISAFFVWMLFFDHNDFITQFKRKAELNDLNKSKDYYKDQIRVTREELESLQKNTSSLEKVAREKYLMKKDNEDIFIVHEN